MSIEPNQQPEDGESSLANLLNSGNFACPVNTSDSQIAFSVLDVLGLANREKTDMTSEDHKCLASSVLRPNHRKDSFLFDLDDSPYLGLINKTIDDNDADVEVTDINAGAKAEPFSKRNSANQTGVERATQCTSTSHGTFVPCINKPTTSKVGATKSAVSQNDWPKNPTPSTSAGGVQHDTTVFRVQCVCNECTHYRETIVQLFQEDHEFNTLWNKLQVLVRQFYDLIPENMPLQPSFYPPSKWSGDGRAANPRKNIQFSLGSNLPPSNDMTFILVFSVLYRRDPHQLFELLGVHLRSIFVAYSDGLKQIIKTVAINEPTTPVASTSTCSNAGSAGGDRTDPSQKPSYVHIYDPVVLLNFLLDGYESICKSAKKLSPLLFELQRGHLHNFSLSWMTLNKRIFQRWVYWDIRDLMPECILKLKTVLDAEHYRSLVYRFIQFDDDMTLLTFKWREIWTRLNSYHLTAKDRRRRDRIITVNEMLYSIKLSTFNMMYTFDEAKLCSVSWMASCADRHSAWAYTVHYLRNRWTGQQPEPRLSTLLIRVVCVKCMQLPAAHFFECGCRTCALVGGSRQAKKSDSSKHYCCTKCMEYERIDRKYLDGLTDFVNSPSAVDDEESVANPKMQLVYQPPSVSVPTMFTSGKHAPSNAVPAAAAADDWHQEHSYHLAWAVFSHFPDRRPYTSPHVARQHFCTQLQTPCIRNECRVAAQILAGLYPLNFSRFLVSSYQPLSEYERTGLMYIPHIYLTYLIRKLCNENSKALGQYCASVSDTALLDVDDTNYLLLCDLGSAFAECYLSDSWIPVDNCFAECFMCTGFDIELNMQWLESRYKDDVGCEMGVVEEDEGAGAAAMSATDRQTAFRAKNGLEADLKLRELREIGEHMDKLFLDKNALKRALIRQEDIIRMSLTDIKRSAEYVSKEFLGSPFLASIMDPMSPAEDLIAGLAPTTAAHCTLKEEDCTAKTCDHMAEAIKLAVNQKLNLHLEEELRSLKEEHSVLKDMVRDLEQLKEDEEKKTESGNKSPVASTSGPVNGSNLCCPDHADCLETHPSKLCHRVDGQCACYYCTLFGHGDCQHDRGHDTRVRLRKKLNQQSAKDKGKETDKELETNGIFFSGKSPLSQPMKAILAAIDKDIARVHRPPSSLSSSSNASPMSTPPTSPIRNLMRCIPECQLPSKYRTADRSAASTTPHEDEDETGSSARTRGFVMPIKEIKRILANATVTIPKTSPKPTKVSGVKPTAAVSISKAKVIVQAPLASAPPIPPPPTASSNTTVEGSSSSRSTPTTPAEPMARSAPTPAAASNTTNTNASSTTTTTTTNTTTNEEPLETIEQLVEFIEGPSTSSKREQQKKAAKKAKQKQRKINDKKVEELEQLRTEFHEIFYKESAAKTELKTHTKASTKKEKKKLSDAEGNTKRLAKLRANLEATILERIAELKKSNSEFKFAYLPTKEQQLEHQAKTAEMKVTKNITKDADTDKIDATKELPKSDDCLKPKDFPPADGRISTGSSANDSDSSGGSDPTKQIVTIRRVNFPHSDPQVTVTAKGASPDKDQLLYTFVNGQMLAETVNGNDSRQESPVQSLADVYDMQHKQLLQMNQNRHQQQAASAAATTPSTSAQNVQTNHNRVAGGNPSNAVAPPVVLSARSQKRALKKERQATEQALREKAEREKAARDQAAQEHAERERIERERALAATARKESIDESCSSGTASTTQSKSNKGKNQQPAKPKSAPPTTSKKANDRAVDDVIKMTKNLHLNNTKPAPVVNKPKEKRMVKAPRFEYADPKYKDNKFDVLDMDADECSMSEEEPEEEIALTPNARKHGSANTARKDMRQPALNTSRGSSTKDNAAFTTVRANKQEKAKTKGNAPVAPPAAAAPGMTPKKSVATGAKFTNVATPPTPPPPKPRHISPYIRTPQPPQPIEIQLSKKQLKKLAQQQTRLAAQATAAQATAAQATAAQATAAATAAGDVAGAGDNRPVNRSTGAIPKIPQKKPPPPITPNTSETMAQTLKNSMQRLSLNDETTAALVRELHLANAAAQAAGEQQLGSPNSIIEQLNRGVKMDGLTLPPGITLTRVGPNHKETLRKRESINSLSQPMAEPADAANPLPPPQDQNGIILVDTAQLKANRAQQQQPNNEPDHLDNRRGPGFPALYPDGLDQPRTNKKNRRRRNKNHQQAHQQHQEAVVQPEPAAQPSRLVTLRNPMFQPSGLPMPSRDAPPPGFADQRPPAFAEHRPKPAVVEHRPPAANQPIQVDQPATIINNLNGMYTIRNPLLHQALTQNQPAEQQANVVTPKEYREQQQQLEQLLLQQQQQQEQQRRQAPLAEIRSNPTNRTPTATAAVVHPMQSSRYPSRQQESFSLFSDHNVVSAPPSSLSSSTSRAAEPTQAIGSELRSVQQQRMQQHPYAWPQRTSPQPPTALTNSTNDLFSRLHQLNPQQQQQQQQQEQQAQHSFGGASGISVNTPNRRPSPYSFNGDFIGSSPASTSNRTTPSVGPTAHSSSFYNNTASNAAPAELPNNPFAAFACSSGLGSVRPSSATSSSLLSSNAAAAAAGAIDSSYMFGEGATALESPTPGFFGGAPLSASDYVKNYDDLQFLHNLQPGQRLNSEVTIHNVSESKFYRGETPMSGNSADGVEITPISSSSSSSQRLASASGNRLHHLHQQQQQQHQQLPAPLLAQSPHINAHLQRATFNPPQMPAQQYQQPQLFNQQQQSAFGMHGHSEMHQSSSGGGGESSLAVGSNRVHRGGAESTVTDLLHNPFGGSNLADGGVFAPNQRVSLSDLESEERDIESFKRFSYYFQPPANKPKVNFDVKNIVLANKAKTTPSSSDSSSPFLSEPASLHGGTPLLDDIYSDLSLLSLSGGLAAGVSNAEDLGILAGGGARIGLLQGNDQFGDDVDPKLDDNELKDLVD